MAERSMPIIRSRILPFLIALSILFLSLTGCSLLPSSRTETSISNTPAPTSSAVSERSTTTVASTTQALALPDKRGYYTSPDDVAAYINAYQKLPDHYITKREAAEKGWDASLGNLWDVTDQMSIGGDRFGNREKLLPDLDGRIWYECDVNYFGGFRGPERLVYSNDGLVYYTQDHYQSFTRLY